MEKQEEVVGQVEEVAPTSSAPEAQNEEGNVVDAIEEKVGQEEGQEEEGDEEDEEEELPVDVPQSAKGEGVRFQLVSDLHLEFPGCLDKLPHIPVNAPILCLLGSYPPPPPPPFFISFRSLDLKLKK
jgi:hypothetical protein